MTPSSFAMKWASTSISEGSVAEEVTSPAYHRANNISYGQRDPGGTKTKQSLKIFMHDKLVCMGKQEVRRKRRDPMTSNAKSKKYTYKGVKERECNQNPRGLEVAGKGERTIECLSLWN